jgi:hypothetical protein
MALDGLGEQHADDLSRKEFLAFTTLEVVICLAFAVFLPIGGAQ